MLFEKRYPHEIGYYRDRDPGLTDYYRDARIIFTESPGCVTDWCVTEKLFLQQDPDVLFFTGRPGCKTDDYRDPDIYLFIRESFGCVTDSDMYLFIREWSGCVTDDYGDPDIHLFIREWSGCVTDDYGDPDIYLFIKAREWSGCVTGW